MAANSALILTAADFDTLKANFKEFLKTQSVFKDYDYSGANINVFLDVLSYNSYLNAFYLNMVGSEMFLDSAQQYDSVVSHAKELNYVPRSNRSTEAEVELVVSTSGINGGLTVPKGTRFTGFNANGSFTFTTDSSETYTSSNSTYNLSNVVIYEGNYFQDAYLVDRDLENQQFILSTAGVDTSSITVSVVTTNGSYDYAKADTLFGLDDSSNVFFLQATHNNLYEISFGDGLFGRQPENNNGVVIRYRVSSGPVADGISTFVLQDDIGPFNNGQVTVEEFTTVANSSSGALQESIDSIRFSAPRYFATQQRAISSDDYKSLVLTQFGGEISDVNVYGGDTVEPKLYGRVMISIKPAGSGTIASDYLKGQVENYLQDYIALPNRVVITDPEYVYVIVGTEVQYDPTRTTASASDLKTSVINAITAYSDENLERFKADLRYSKLLKAIDDVDQAIVSNDTDLRVIKRIAPIADQDNDITFTVGNVLYYPHATFSSSEEHVTLHQAEVDMRFDHATLVSSAFTFNASDGNVYDFAFLEDVEGTVKVFAPIAEDIVEIETVGTINYTTGYISIRNFNVNNYGPYISVYIRSRYKDVFAEQNRIVVIEASDLLVTVVEARS